MSATRTRTPGTGRGLLVGGLLVGGLLSATLLTGCSSGAGPSGAAGPAPSSTPSSTTTAGDPTTGEASGVPSSPSGGDPTTTASAASSDPATSSADPTPASSPAGSSRPVPSRSTGGAPMAPPTLVAAAAESCRPLTGGGREATFSVSFTGGDRWTLLPEDGPVSPLGGGAWKVVVDAASGSSSVTLRHVKVGGGSPFTTAVLPLPASMVATTAC